MQTPVLSFIWTEFTYKCPPIGGPEKRGCFTSEEKHCRKGQALKYLQGPLWLARDAGWVAKDKKEEVDNGQVRKAPQEVAWDKAGELKGGGMSKPSAGAGCNCAEGKDKELIYCVSTGCQETCPGL